jgi:hypothetical protein
MVEHEGSVFLRNVGQNLQDCTFHKRENPAEPLLGNELTKTFPRRWILGNQFVTELVSVETGVQQAFPWVLIRYITGNSDQKISLPFGGVAEYFTVALRVVGGDEKEISNLRQ